VLGDKEGMAKSYLSLGLVYSTQGDLTQAEAMYRKALALFQKIGATLHIEHVQELMRALYSQKSR
jgi:Tfp pilus assembly protein PilF